MNERFERSSDFRIVTKKKTKKIFYLIYEYNLHILTYLAVLYKSAFKKYKWMNLNKTSLYELIALLI